MRTPALLEVRQLSVRYAGAAGATPVVHEADLEVAAGECLGIAGESGSGKTQLLWAILGLSGARAAISGSITIESAKPPVTHMPIAPTPGPPHSWWASRANARSQSVTGLDLLVRKIVNSREMQSERIRIAEGFSGLLASGSPNRMGA